MLILRKLNRSCFWLLLVLTIIPGHALYGEQQLPEDIAETALAWINAKRSGEGLEPIAIDSRLNKVAETYSAKMIEQNTLTDSAPESGTPFERIQSSGLTDTNNLVVVAKAETWAILMEQLESTENLSKILSSEMTHTGIGLKQDSSESLWLTIHLIERAITFNQFILNQSNTTPAERSITIKGNTSCKKIKAILVPIENPDQDMEADRFITPDSNGNFETTISFGTATGNFNFEFYVQKNEEYELKNFFSMNI